MCNRGITTEKELAGPHYLIQGRKPPSKREAFTQRCFNVGHRLQRWPNIETALGEYLVFAGLLWWREANKGDSQWAEGQQDWLPLLAGGVSQQGARDESRLPLRSTSISAGYQQSG